LEVAKTKQKGYMAFFDECSHSDIGIPLGLRCWMVIELAFSNNTPLFHFKQLYLNNIPALTDIPEKNRLIVAVV